jgi:hypothetical protein
MSAYAVAGGLSRACAGVPGTRGRTFRLGVNRQVPKRDRSSCKETGALLFY